MTHTAPQASSAAPAAARETGRLSLLRWAVRATLTLGVAASVAANVLHARPNPISQIIAAWPPLALLLTVELISRVPHHRWQLGAIRVTAATCIAAIAAWVSYWHLAGVAARYGENSYGAAYLLPLSVDGLVIVASVSLVEISARIRATTIPDDTMSLPAPTSQIAEPSNAAAAQGAAPTASASQGEKPVTGASPQPLPLATEPGTAPVTGDSSAVPAPAAEGKSRTCMADLETETNRESVQADDQRGAGTEEHAATPPADTSTAAAVAYWRHHDPQLQPADVAVRIGKSERTVRRHWQPATPGRAARANGRSARQRRR
ncbi:MULTISPECIES: DUF2637 domain-containing protein [unclassified Micromonospora]|uniref:DUF2637 domain-containing protein n=1 Tax=unclassified Micromonospora TaxID=2617518 RepID=UPI001C218237|nr:MULTISPECIES: DUF2637 domain-containing protein [unclassified Micromonospora]MBU8857772.1 DUF2637 domain-containing protein [Micromonospora sp. WMMB482]MDM4783401.1 DUF2637 domain-containing protein [Micromonospora sp. b486]